MGGRQRGELIKNTALRDTGRQGLVNHPLGHPGGSGYLRMWDREEVCKLGARVLVD